MRLLTRVGLQADHELAQGLRGVLRGDDAGDLRRGSLAEISRLLAGGDAGCSEGLHGVDGHEPGFIDALAFVLRLQESVVDVLADGARRDAEAATVVLQKPDSGCETS